MPQFFPYARFGAVALALVMLAAGCVSRSGQTTTDQPSARYGSGLTEEAEDGGVPVEMGPRGGGENAVVEIPGRTAPPGAAQPGAPARSGGIFINDDGDLGALAHFYLNRIVPRLVVEITAVRGFEPSPAALRMLRERLEQVADKPGGIEILPVQTIDGGRDRWTTRDLASLEARHRNHQSTRDAMVMYILYVNGELEGASGAIGVAYKASTFTIFVEKIRREAATPLVPAGVIESSVVVHEAGHLLSLVNIGYSSPRDREDRRHRGHSSNPDSVMYWAVDNVGVVNLLGGRTAPPTQFDGDDLADLADIREGRLP